MTKNLSKSKKLIVLASTLLFTLVSIIYISIAPAVWTSQAVLQQPSHQELRAYAVKVKQYNEILGSEDINISQNVFNQFKQLLTSSEVQAQVFTRTQLFHQLVKQGKTKEQALNELTAQLQINNGLQPLEVSVAFSANDAVIAQKTLQQFMGNLNQYTVTKIMQDFVSQVNLSKTKFEKELKEMAQHTNIDNGNALSEDYILLESKLKSIYKLMATKNMIRFNSASYKVSPTLPTVEDKSNDILIVSLSAVLGLLFGLLIVLGLNFRSKIKIAPSIEK